MYIMSKTKKNLKRRQKKLYKLREKVRGRACRLQKLKIKKNKCLKSKKRLLKIKTRICKTKKLLKKLEYQFRSLKISCNKGFN